jgi:membrane protein DedA with SNARE-associated domain
VGRSEAFFERHGGKAVFLARFFAGLWVFAALIAGMSRMSWGKSRGGVVWATAAVALGYFLGARLQTTLRKVR